MAIQPFLAFGWAEMENQEEFPPHTAWLGCHFSLSGQGLSNIPRRLPPQSLLVVDDASPIDGHDPALVSSQLQAVTEELGCSGVLLDFQRTDQTGAEEMAAAIVAALPCPVAVSSLYAANLSCPVFLPPPAPSTPLAQALWPERECWLELALDGERITLTEAGAERSALDWIPDRGFREETLHCHYALELQAHRALWRLWRTREDLLALLEEADALGVTRAVGLYQELKIL